MKAITPFFKHRKGFIMDKTNLANRMKMYEKLNTEQFMPLLPIYVRLDGRAFHTFCRGLDKPFDFDLMDLMQKVTKKLVDSTNACWGYTQSDEISLFWNPTSVEDQLIFNGKKQKMISVLASIATAEFILQGLKVPKMKERIERFGVNFDCRIFQLPNKSELTNTFLWREIDARRNSVSMLAQSLYSHKQLQNKNMDALLQMCRDKGKEWYDLPNDCKRGSWFKRGRVRRELTDEELNKIPEKYRPTERMVIRTEVQKMDLPLLKDVSNRSEVLFDNEEVKLIEEL